MAINKSNVINKLLFQKVEHLFQKVYADELGGEKTFEMVALRGSGCAMNAYQWLPHHQMI